MYNVECVLKSMKIKSISFPIAFGESFLFSPPQKGRKIEQKKYFNEKMLIERASGKFSFPGTLKTIFSMS